MKNFYIGHTICENLGMYVCLYVCMHVCLVYICMYKIIRYVLYTYISVFLCNSELWTLTKLLVKEIDIFQRSVIKKIFIIHWQDKITNVKLCRRYKLKVIK